MKTALAVGALAVVLLFASPAYATGGSETFRIVGNADVYVLALSSSCPPSSTALTCVVLRDTLGYNGLTGASTTATTAHVNHAFECAVTGSALFPVGSALPFPANMAISDSIVVGFDLNGDGSADTSYGGRIQRYPIGATQNRITGAVNNADVGTLADTPGWWLANFALNGATPVVSGNVDHANLIIWNQAGFDVNIDCTF